MCTKNKKLIQEKSNLLLPEFDDFEIANDKEKSLLLCEKAGIAYPHNYEVSNIDDLRIIAKEIKFPVVIKARSGSGTEFGLRYANNKEELFVQYNEVEMNRSACAYDYSRPLVQEFIPGYIHDACTFSIDGELVNCLTQTRSLMYPIYGGVGAVNVTTKDKNLMRLAEIVIEAFNWTGPAQIEFKYDPRDKVFKFIELNPKLWGTLDLSIKAGYNFPKLILDFVTEGKVYKSLDYKENVKYTFKYSQALFAKKQLNDIKRIDLYPDKAVGAEQYSDFCLSDPLPDISRAVKSYGKLWLGEINNNNANLDIDFVLGLKI